MQGHGELIDWFDKITLFDFHTSLILHMHLVGEYLPVSSNRTAQV